MGEGNPGGMNVLMQLVNSYGNQGFMSVLWLDTWEIYGSKLWVLYKDVCGESIENTYYLVRAAQLGFLDSQDLREFLRMGSRTKPDPTFISGMIQKAKSSLVP
jgi:hypothetical protein